jgi:hypothetical protein
VGFAVWRKTRHLEILSGAKSKGDAPSAAQELRLKIPGTGQSNYRTAAFGDIIEATLDWKRYRLEKI